MDQGISTCPKCGRLVPTANFLLHDATCGRARAEAAKRSAAASDARHGESEEQEFDRESNLTKLRTLRVKELKIKLSEHKVRWGTMIEKDEMVQELCDAMEERFNQSKNFSRSGSHNTTQKEVIALDSDSDVELLAPSRSNAALKSTNGNDGGEAPFVPFHLYATTTAKSQLRTNDAAKKYFRTMREIIGIDGNKSKRKFQWLVIFNFLIDFDYVLQKLMPDLLQFHRVIVFYGSAGGTEGAVDQWRQLLAGTGNTVEIIQLIPSDPPRSRLNPLPMKIIYGVHHTKMFLMGYEENNQSMCRVVVHTANLIPGDIECKTQGAYCQDFPLKGKKESQNQSKMPAVVNPYKRKRDDTMGKTAKGGGYPFEEDDTPFEDDLVTYLESYLYVTRQTWCTGNVLSTGSTSKNRLSNKAMSWLQLIRQYDYSTAYAVLIPSVPGRHKDDSYNNFGYLKLRQAIIEWVCPHLPNSKKQSTPKPVLCQFSSIGSLNAKWLDQFLSAIDSSSTQDVDPIIKSSSGKSKEKPPPLSSRMKLIWPTTEEIRVSTEGYRGGGSVPGKVQNLSKEFLQPLYHRWSSRRSGSNSDPFKTARHVPHIKTFLQPSSSIENGIEWLVLTSHNLSIAAWGQLQKRSDQSRSDEKVLFIRHWEMGVFISPATLAKMTPDTAVNDICMTPYPGISRDAVINLDSDDEDENETTKVLVPLPFSMDPTPYNDNDIPWALDRSCSVPDSFGCIIP